MKKIYKVAIVGGGFSAMTLAASLKPNICASTIILERNDRLGKKILSTGNGRGNITNKNISVENYHGQNPKFCEYAVTRYSGASLKSFFSELGLMFVSEEDRIYPASMQANSISDVLRYKIGLSDVEVRLKSQVTDVTRSDKDGLFKLVCGDETIYAENVVMAFGGAAQKQFGTDGSAFSLAKKLGHTVTDLTPSLVQMRSDAQIIKGLKGIRAQVKCSMYNGEREVKSTYGDILFTDGGISGNAAFFLSAYLNVDNAKIVVEFIPEISENRLIDQLLYKASCYKQLETSELLNGVVHKQVGKNIVKSITQKSTLGELSEKEIRSICRKIKCFEIPIKGTLGFDYAQVTRGGVVTKELDLKTFESKLKNGLYFIGEAIDIDGDCGGYNLQWAYSSAACCAEALNAKNI